MWRKLIMIFFSRILWNYSSKMQRKVSSSERRVLPSWLAGLCLLLKPPWECVTNSHAVQMRGILLLELFVWEMHKKIECLHLRRWLKREFSQVWHCVISTSLQSLAEKWEAPSQRGDVQDHRCQHFHTHSVTDLQSRWSWKGSSPRIALQHTVHPASFPHSSHPFLGWVTMEVNTSWRKTACHHHFHQVFPVNLFPLSRFCHCEYHMALTAEAGPDSYP